MFRYTGKWCGRFVNRLFIAAVVSARRNNTGIAGAKSSRIFNHMDYGGCDCAPCSLSVHQPFNPETVTSIRKRLPMPKRIVRDCSAALAEHLAGSANA